MILPAWADSSGGDNACWPWRGTIMSMGYGMKGSRLAHRFVFETLVRPLNPGECVLHRCDNPPCVNPLHLFPGTQADNVADMHAKGRARKRGLPGESHHQAKLTGADVAAIRASTEPQRVLARRFGVGQSQVWRIKHGRSWR